MKLGLISDVHGNCLALEAVVADASSVGVDRWWVLGDLVAIGPDPVATIELVANLPHVEAIRGNTERYVLASDRPPPTPSDVITNPDLFELYGTIQRSFAWTGGALASHGWLKWLSDQPLDLRTELPDGTIVLGVHASPGRDDGEGITPHRDEEELRHDLEGAEHRRVDYDREAFLSSVEQSGHPASDYIASFQRGEHVRFAATRPGAPDLQP